MVNLRGMPFELTVEAAGGELRLAYPRRDNFESWAALRRANIDYLRPWEPDVSVAGLNKSAYRVRVGRLKKLIQQDRAYPFYVFFGDALVGACNITHVERGATQSARIGYWIGEKYTGQGFAQASVQAVTHFCFHRLVLHRVDAAVQCDNLASIKVLQASGYKYEGTARSLLNINGVWRDHDIYARLIGDKSA